LATGAGNGAEGVLTALGLAAATGEPGVAGAASLPPLPPHAASSSNTTNAAQPHSNFADLPVCLVLLSLAESVTISYPLRNESGRASGSAH
jgi:hypothetical protein